MSGGSKGPKPEFPPLLPSGMHTLPEAELYELTVRRFKSSTRRSPLWQSLMQFCDELRDEGLVPCKLWLDGSFLTEKVEPEDIDLIVEASSLVVDHVLTVGSPIVETIVEQHLHSEPRNLHTFLLPTYTVFHPEHPNFIAARDYWEYSFGHALLSKQPKGIAILEVGP